MSRLVARLVITARSLLGRNKSSRTLGMEADGAWEDGKERKREREREVSRVEKVEGID